MDYEGVIIEESLCEKAVMQAVKITSTKTESVTKEHNTPWLKQWTLHTVTITESRAEDVADRLSKSLADNYWYADFKNDTTHYIVFPNKIFKIDRRKAEQYRAATDYGATLGIPSYQLDFAPGAIQWQRPTEK